MPDDLLHHVAGNMAADHVPLVIFAGLVVGLVAVIVALSWLLGERHRARYRDIPFESGVEPIGPARVRFPVHYYLVALLFLIFDVEVAFIFAWAVAWEDLGWLGYAEMVVFVLVLFAGLVYAWKKGILDWLVSAREQPPAGGGCR
jgi:NADH-quinone oxidoreductase subunit A